jgi:hypothetical protein
MLRKGGVKGGLVVRLVRALLLGRIYSREQNWLPVLHSNLFSAHGPIYKGADLFQFSASTSQVLLRN